MMFKSLLLIALATQAASLRIVQFDPWNVEVINEVFVAILDFIRAEMVAGGGDYSMPLENLNVTAHLELSKLEGPPQLKKRLIKLVKNLDGPTRINIYCTRGTLEKLEYLFRDGNVYLGSNTFLNELAIVGETTADDLTVSYETCNVTFGTNGVHFRTNLNLTTGKSFIMQKFLFKGEGKTCVPTVPFAFFTHLDSSLVASTGDPLLTTVINYLIKDNMEEVTTLLSEGLHDALSSIVEGNGNICKFFKSLKRNLRHGKGKN